MKMKNLMAILAISLSAFLLPSCLAAGGALAGGGLGFGIARATGMNKTGATLMTVAGAGGGAYLGHQFDKKKTSDADWKQLHRESDPIRDLEPTVERPSDGTTKKRTAMRHKPTDKRWDLVQVWGAPNGNIPPKLEDEYAIWME